MHKLLKGLAGVALSALLAVPGAMAADAVDSGMTIYFQMGGNPGDTATLARELGARDAARVLKVKLIEQHAGWDPQKMLTQASEAVAAQPDAMVVMGHPGTSAMKPILDQAKQAGIVVVVNNNELPDTGLSYFGLNNYQAGRNLAQLTIDNGSLKAGDKVLVYGAFIQGAAGYDVGKGTTEVLKEKNIAFTTLQWSNEAVQDPALSVPVLVAYLESNPDTKAIIVPGHGGITAVSDGMVPLNTTVNQPPPIITPPPILPPPPTSALFADAGLRLRQGGLESDFLVGASVYRTLIAAQPGTINVSADVFSGSDSAKNLRFEAGSVSGGPLPPWIAFDPILLRFSGTPPESAVGTLDLRVIATDKAGRQATAEVHVVITRPPRDILGLLRPSATPPAIIVPQPLPPAPPQAPPEALPTGAPADAPAPANAPPAEGGAPAGPASPPNAPSESMPERSTERAFQRFGLSAQLREQSLAGRLARSRALMNALGGGRASL